MRRKWWMSSSTFHRPLQQITYLTKMAKHSHFPAGIRSLLQPLEPSLAEEGGGRSGEMCSPFWNGQELEKASWQMSTLVKHNLASRGNASLRQMQCPWTLPESKAARTRNSCSHQNISTFTLGNLWVITESCLGAERRCQGQVQYTVLYMTDKRLPVCLK